MKRWVRAWTLLAAAWLVGCAAVTSSRPVGEAPAPLSAEEWKGQIVVLLPDADRIGALVESGALPGAKVEGIVRLGPLTADHVRRLVEDPSGVCPFDWKEPLVLTRVGK